MLFLPCIFKEFSAQDKGMNNGNEAEDDTTETLNIADAETMNGNATTFPKKGLALKFFLAIVLHAPYHILCKCLDNAYYFAQLKT